MLNSKVHSSRFNYSLSWSSCQNKYKMNKGGYEATQWRGKIWAELNTKRPLVDGFFLYKSTI